MNPMRSFRAHVRRWAIAIAGANVATTVRLLRFGVRDAASRACAAYRASDPFGHMAEARHSDLSRLPVVALNVLLRERPAIVVDTRFIDTDGSLPLYELLCLLMLTRQERPTGILEVGTYFGSTTVNLAINLPEARIHTIDLPPGYLPDGGGGELPKDDFHLIRARRVGAAFVDHSVRERITQHFGDTATYDFRSIQDPVSFFFIDGSHTYEYARNDTLRCLEFAKGSSTFLWHDCDDGHPGVVQWLAEMVDRGIAVVRIAGTNTAYAKIDAASTHSTLLGGR